MRDHAGSDREDVKPKSLRASVLHVVVQRELLDPNPAPKNRRVDTLPLADPLPKPQPRLPPTPAHASLNVPAATPMARRDASLGGRHGRGRDGPGDHRTSPVRSA